MKGSLEREAAIHLHMPPEQVETMRSGAFTPEQSTIRFAEFAQIANFVAPGQSVFEMGCGHAWLLELFSLLVVMKKPNAP